MAGSTEDKPIILDVEAGAGARDVVAAAGTRLTDVVVLGTLDGDARLLGLLGRPFALLPKEASGSQLRAALDAINSGLVVVDPLIAERLFAPGDAPAAGAPGGARAVEPSSDDPASSDHLTTREREVLELVAEGLPNKTIARRLAISDHTVKFHIASLMTKLGAASRTEAVHLGARRGIISL